MNNYAYKSVRLDSCDVDLDNESKVNNSSQEEEYLDVSLADYRRAYVMNQPPPSKKPAEVFRRALIKIRGYRLWLKMLQDIRIYGTGCTLFDADDLYKKNLESIMVDKVLVNRTENTLVFKYRPWICEPEGRFRAMWDSVVCVLILYTFTVLPVLVAFCNLLPGSGYFSLDLFVDVMFFLDVVIALNTAYKNKEGFLVKDNQKILIFYVKSSLIIDFFSIFPFSYIFSDEPNVRLLKLLKIVRILKIKKLKGLFSVIKEHLSVVSKYQGVTRLVSGMVIVLIMTHFIACLWCLTSKVAEFTPETWAVRRGWVQSNSSTFYLSGLYWACTVLTTVGYGDITAVTTAEYVLSIIWMVCGIGFYSVVVGSLSSVLSSLDEKQEVIRAKLDLLDLFIKGTKLPDDFGVKLKKKFQKSLQELSLDSSERLSLVNSLSKELKFKISMAMYQGAASTIDFFVEKQEKNKAFISDIIPRLEHRIYVKNETVYKKDKYADEMYFIVEGRVTYIYGAQRLRFKDIIKGSYFGEIEMIEQIPREFGAVSLEISRLLVMKKDVFDYMLSQYPYVQTEMKEIARKRKIKNNRAKGEIIDVLEIVHLKRLATYQELAGNPFIKSTVVPAISKQESVKKIEEEKYLNQACKAIHEKFDSLEDSLDEIINIISFSQRIRLPNSHMTTIVKK